jgi:hypothetical protein
MDVLWALTPLTPLTPGILQKYLASLLFRVGL